ncbi:hypothetical protein Pth03_30320 [Planotetraspora thailandica]|uniref:Cell envelope-related transcriptional attenuator domain-containing protein n=1 Tax=Planotetraspora thailandica TaxID=487172 RepID=A0A8J3UZC5_9ACTN|nr:LCP family protein [Planotetraspora thailandica]GII54643.1 hypothetical protein Pth03_30320 [Planotetraspora thailandica]
MEDSRDSAAPEGAAGRPAPRRRRRRIAAACGICAIVLTAGTTAGGYHLIGSYEREIKRIPGAFPPENRRFHTTAPAVRGQTWLVAGADRTDQWGPRPQASEAVLLVRLPADGSAVRALSLPRDVSVPIPGHGRGRIGAAFSLGGPPLLVETVEHVMRVRVDHFAMLDVAGFENVIDVLGGVDVGGYHLNGHAALGYVRDRGSGGDFLRALAARVTEPEVLANPFRMDALIRAFTRSVGVDSSVDLGRLAGDVARVAGGARIEMLGSHAARKGREPVRLLDVPQARARWAALLGTR